MQVYKCKFYGENKNECHFVTLLILANAGYLPN